MLVARMLFFATMSLSGCSVVDLVGFDFHVDVLQALFDYFPGTGRFACRLSSGGRCFRWLGLVSRTLTESKEVIAYSLDFAPNELVNCIVVECVGNQFAHSSAELGIPGQNEEFACEIARIDLRAVNDYVRHRTQSNTCKTLACHEYPFKAFLNSSRSSNFDLLLSYLISLSSIDCIRRGMR